MADIAFIVDITTSMKPFIEDAKAKLIQFIKTSYANGYHIRMCLVKFGDYTVLDEGQASPCDRFYDSANEAEVKQFITALNDLYAADRTFDPGAPDFAENPFRSLVDTAKRAPWGKDSLRFAIMVTDAAYQYDPTGISEADHQILIAQSKTPKGNFEKLNPHAGQDARFIPPRMNEVNQAISSAELKVFPVTPNLPAYNGDFDGQPGVAASSGEFTEFRTWKNGALNKILKRILNSINTTYKISYNVEKNSLSPELKITQRDIQVSTGKGDVSVIKKAATNEQGRPNYKQTFTIDSAPVQPDSVQVFVNGVAITRSEFSVSGGDVIFKKVPPPGADLRFVYLYQDIAKNFDRRPIPIAGNASNTKVILNGKVADPADLVFEAGPNGSSRVNVRPSALADSDPYKIRENRGLKIKVISNL